MLLTVITPDKPSWMDFIGNFCFDIYHLPEYFVIETKRFGGEALAICIENGDNKLFLPFIKRSINLNKNPSVSIECFDAISPYGYPCPLINIQGKEAHQFLKESIPFIKKELNRLGIISLFIRFHPILSDPYIFQGDGIIVQHGETVWCDLTKSEADLWNQLRKGHKQDIKSLQNTGYTAFEDVEWDNLDKFIYLYHATMRRVSAEKPYYFDKEYFMSLKKLLEKRINLWFVKKETDIITGGIFFECNGIVQYHLSASNPDSKVPGTKLMLYKVMQNARALGNVVFHLGGGLGAGNDSLLYFKSGFSNLRKGFFTWRWIINSKEYAAHIEDWQRCSGIEADDIKGYFPAYRKEVPK